MSHRQIKLPIFWVLAQGVETIRAHEVKLTQQLLAGLTTIPGVTVYGSLDAAAQTATVSFNMAGIAPSVPRR